MRNQLLISAFVIVLCAFISGVGICADTWTVFSYPGGNPLAPGSASEIVFTLNNGVLSLNTNTIATQGGSSANTWTLLFSGNWAACGTIDDSGGYVPDPYATFHASGQGGHIEWAGSTPSGYTAPLMLGASFAGDGAATYTASWGSPIYDVSSTLVVNRHPTYWGPEYSLYESASHTVYATYAQTAGSMVPEPASLLALLTGGISIAGFGLRARRAGRR